MSKRKPLIGITATSFPEPDGFDPMIAVERPYLESVQAAGGIPVVIPYLNSDQDLSEVFNMCDGFLFPGGKDVSPQNYNEEPHPKLGEIDRSQDRTEIAIIKRCVEEKKPFVGICRGLQVINVALGGTLYQDLPSQYPTSEDHSHSTTPEQFRTLIHTIKIQPNSLLHNILNSDEIGINSSHHQAIKVLGAGLVVTATSRDNLIEAIELPSHPYMVAVQGHPEVIWQKSEPRWKNYFDSFINALK